MENAMVKDGVAAAVLDALSSQICIVDRNGDIIAVNEAWRQFGASNSGACGADHIGTNYLAVCRHSAGCAAEEAPAFAEGLRAVLDGEKALFQTEYPCHSPKELKWFLGIVSPLRLRREAGGKEIAGAVISHLNITKRKLAEMNYQKLAATDALTGIPNRRFFTEMGESEIARFMRFGEPCSILVADIDNFKHINDSYGHAGGDEVLRRVATLGKTVFRGCDLFARFGGDEFACLLPGADEGGAVVAAEMLRREIERLPVVIGSRTVLVTASIGVTCLTVGDRMLESVLDRADSALYRAKADGRNCVRRLIMPPVSVAAVSLPM